MRTLIVLGLLFPAVTAHAAMTAEDFIRQAGSQAVAAMEAGRMAQATDSAPASVRQLGRDLGSSAAATNQHLQDLAAGAQLPLPAQLEPAERNTLERLSHLRGPAFTRGYLSHATDLLERQRALFQVATTVEDAGLAQLARDTLPTLENQLLVADALHDAQELSANIPGR
ncbi:MAG TPA: DUF4142 domain-containing protein [Magnetospirillum sp.]|jgi:predicted outer membrane protein|nr:DUF4142 domain-containing protein [Magnetospirillum sp.]